MVTQNFRSICWRISALIKISFLIFSEILVISSVFVRVLGFKRFSTPVSVTLKR